MIAVRIKFFTIILLVCNQAYAAGDLECLTKISNLRILAKNHVDASYISGEEAISGSDYRVEIAKKSYGFVTSDQYKQHTDIKDGSIPSHLGTVSTGSCHQDSVELDKLVSYSTWPFEGSFPISLSARV